MTAGVYKWSVNRGAERRPLVYVGQSINLEMRRRQYERDWASNKCNNNRKLHNAVQKYGIAAVRYCILEIVPNISDLTLREQYWYRMLVEQYGRANVANFMLPSENNLIAANERIDLSERMRQRHLDPKFSAATAERMRQRHLDPQIKKEYSERARKQHSNPAYGAALAEAARKAHQKAYPGFISPTGAIFAPVINLCDFCRQHSLAQPNMVAVAAGRRPHHKGWRRYEPPKEVVA